MRYLPGGQFGIQWLALLLVTAPALAQSLPPLSVNPGLLGLTVPAGSVPEPVSGPRTTAPTPEPASTAVPAVPPSSAMVAPAPRPAPVAAPSSPGVGAAPPLSPQPAATVSAGGGEAARGESPPAAAPPAKDAQPEPAVTLRTDEPPQVAERPILPPLYSAHVSAGQLPEPLLRGDSAIKPFLRQPGESLPAFITADTISGRNDVEVVAEGNAELRKRNSILTGQRLTYRQGLDEIEAEEGVSLSRDGDRITGPRMKLKLDESTGFFDQPSYSIRRIKTGSAPTLWTGYEERESSQLTTGVGSAARMEFEGEGRYRFRDATYSTCSPAPGTQPDWYASTGDLQLDYDIEQGSARDATLYFHGAPILHSPWLSFSLNNERKSGLLTPTGGSTSQGGLEFTQPFYWNIAPNQDLTIAPRIMDKRGTLWKSEYRYLQPTYYGNFQGQYLPDDKLLHKRRSSYSYNHWQNLGAGFTGTLTLTEASDDTYFSDLGSGSSVIAQTNLLRQGTLTYGGGWWSANLLAQSFQTLQDPALPKVVEPYRRLPQLTVNASRGDLPLGINFAFQGEHVSFRNPALVEGQRFTLYPQLSLPIQTEVLSLTPKIGVHETRYTLSRQGAGTPDRIARSVPIASLDSSVTFERDLTWDGTRLTQTLEPRIYYLYVPERDQRLIPVFDTALTDFNFAQIFGENRYGGGDRIGDANQATAMLTSRLLDPETGAETLRAAFGQRFYFSTQKVGLPKEIVRGERQTDFLASLSGRVMPKTYADIGVQYNPRLDRMERLNVGGRYQPEIGKLINAGYRYSRDQLGQIDVSAQWPMFGGWHAVGRVNYSTKDGRMIESVAGLEYDGGCWIARVVMQRLATLVERSNTALFLQLELNGFAKVGSNPLDILRRNVPGYGVINQPAADPQSLTP